MKRILILFAASMIIACGNNDYKAGADITEEGAVTGAEMVKNMQGKDSMEVKVTAKINAVCQVKGCWMRLDMGDGKEMMVRFKDYSFFVPKDAAGKTAVIDGWAKTETIGVDELKHYAEDDGKSKEEIDAITQPKTELTFEAKGVIIK